MRLVPQPCQRIENRIRIRILPRPMDNDPFGRQIDPDMFDTGQRPHCLFNGRQTTATMHLGDENMGFQQAIPDIGAGKQDLIPGRVAVGPARWALLGYLRRDTTTHYCDAPTSVFLTVKR